VSSESGGWCECDAQQDQGDPDSEGEQGAMDDRVHVRASVVGCAGGWGADVGCRWRTKGIGARPAVCGAEVAVPGQA
jgi:hypothetical protein